MSKQNLGILLIFLAVLWVGMATWTELQDAAAPPGSNAAYLYPGENPSDLAQYNPPPFTLAMAIQGILIVGVIPAAVLIAVGILLYRKGSYGT